MEKNKKKKIKIISILAAVLAIIIAVSIVASVYSEQIKCAAMYAMMPDTVEGSIDDETPVTLFKGKNADYNYKEDKGVPLAYYEFTLRDNNSGEEYTVKGDEVLYIDGEEIGMLYPDFLPKTLENWANVKSKLITAAVIIIILILIGLIILWYIIWSKKQDEEKERKYGNKNNSNHKKKKK